MQFTKKRKIMILVGMFVLLAVTGYLNFTLNSPGADPEVPVGGSLITNFELKRDSLRAIEIAHYQGLMNQYETDSSQYIEANAKLEAIFADQQFENRCENLIEASFADAIVNRSDGIITVVVQNPTEITREQATLVESILYENSGAPANFDWESVFLTVIQ
jgi:hypothetical protein